MPECNCTWLTKNSGSLTAAQQSAWMLATSESSGSSCTQLCDVNEIFSKYSLHATGAAVAWIPCKKGEVVSAQSTSHRGGMVWKHLSTTRLGRKYLVKPLKCSVGESKGKAQTPFLQALPIATPRRGCKMGHINIWLLPPKAPGKPPQRGRSGTEQDAVPSGTRGSPRQPLSGQLISNKTLFSENNRAQSSTAERPPSHQRLTKP